MQRVKWVTRCLSSFIILLVSLVNAVNVNGDDTDQHTIEIDSRKIYYVCNALYLDDPQVDILAGIMLFHLKQDQTSTNNALEVFNLASEEFADRSPAKEFYIGRPVEYYQAAINAMVGIADPNDSSDPILQAIAIAGEEFGRTARTYLGEWMDPLKIVAVQNESYALYAHLQEFRKKIWENLYDLGQTNSEIANIIDIAFQESLNVSTSDSAEEILGKNPDLDPYGLFSQILNEIQPDGSLTIGLAEIKEMVAEIGADVDGTLEKYIKVLGEIDLVQEPFTAYYHDEKKKEEVKEKIDEIKDDIKPKPVKYQEALEVQFALLTSVTEKIDPDFASNLQVVGGAMTQIASGVERYLLSAMSTTGTVLLTGNVFGAVMQLVSLFGSDSNSMDKAILKEIGRIKEMIGKLHKTMNKRFDRIDKSLNEIYEKIMDIEFDIAVLSGKVDETRMALYKIHANLNRLEGNIYEMFREDIRQDFKNCVGTYLLFKEDLPWEEYETAAACFFNHATITSKDYILAGPELDESNKHLTEDDAIFQELTEGSGSVKITKKINYLSQFPKVRFLQAPFADERLANPADWRASATAFAQLAEEWPDYAAQIKTERYEDIIDVGKALKSALGNIGNEELFKSLLAKYKDDLENLNEKIRAFETLYQNEKDRHVKGIDLWGGAYQKPENKDDDVVLAMLKEKYYNRIDLCKHEDETVSIDKDILDSIFSRDDLRPLFLADYMELGEIKMCATKVGSVISEECDGYGRDRCCTTDKNVTQKVQIWYDDYSDEEGSIYMFNYSKRRDESCDKGPGCPASGCTIIKTHDAIIEHASSFKNKQPEVVGKVNNKLIEYQGDLYTSIQKEFEMEGDIAQAMVRLSGANALLEAYMALGLPISMQSNDLFRWLIYNGGLLTSDGVNRIYLDAVANPPARNIREDIQADQEIKILAEEIDKVLQELDELGQAESDILFEDVIKWLQNIVLYAPAKSE